MTRDWTKLSRSASLLLAGIYVVIAFIAGGAEGGLTVVGCLILPLACIWFSDALGRYTGPTSGASITSPTPGLVVCLLGWLLLLLPVVLMLLQM